MTVVTSTESFTRKTEAQGVLVKKEVKDIINKPLLMHTVHVPINV